MSSGGVGRAIGTVMLLGASLLACTTPAVTPEPSAASTLEAASNTFATPSATRHVAASATAAPTAKPSAAPHPAAGRVEIYARGNLFVRRGPDLAFNAIGVLPIGAVAPASARDVLANWVMIPLPGNGQKTGWVSIMSDFTEVTGDVQELPALEPTDWPQLAFLRNCTFHELSANPGGIVLPAVDNFPSNDVRVNPGFYSVVDLDVDGYPEVLKIEIQEGSSVDIVVDGNGEKKKCPVP